MTVHILRASNTPYNQIHQSYPLKYSFLKKSVENNYPEMFCSVLCKDYFNDVLYAEERGEIQEIFGFRYDPNESQIDRDKTRLSLHFPTKAAKEQTLKNLGFLHKLETDNGLELTIITESQHDLIVMVEGDPYWLSATYLISFYTSFLRWLGYPLIEGQPVSKTISTISCTDNAHLTNYKCVDRMMFFEQNIRCLDEQLQDKDSGVFSEKGKLYDISQVHNSGGILGTLMLSPYSGSLYSKAFNTLYSKSTHKCAA